MDECALIDNFTSCCVEELQGLLCLTMRDGNLFENGADGARSEARTEVQCSDCTDCGGCVVHCAFLQEHGTPGQIAKMVESLPPSQWPDPFGCSLCGLCGAVCPEGVRPEELFLDMRRTRAQAGGLDLKQYGPVITYEKLGSSRLFSLLRVPEGGDTVLFPGCALPSTRSTTVRRLFQALQEIIPSVGIALGCCTKPSHDLGRTNFFDQQFGGLHARLVSAGVKRVVTACPNCQKIFSAYGGEIEAVTAYSLLADSGYEPVSAGGGTAIIHDPCPQRYDAATQDSVRTLTARCGVSVGKAKAERKRTQCCGEGGMVKFVRPDFADAWTSKRTAAAAGQRVVTSCAGCTNFLGATMDVDHVLDLLFDSRSARAIKPPFTYLARLRLKAWFKRMLR